MAAPEAVPYAKTGGLADVAGTLPPEFLKMKRKDFSVNLFMPYYRKIKNSIQAEDTGKSVSVKIGPKKYTASLFRKDYTIFIGCDEFFDREELYGTPAGDYPDNAQRFIFFARAVLETSKTLDIRPDILHCHDWQTALVPLYLKTLYKKDPFFSNTKSVFTIHNLGYQGVFPKETMALTGLGMELFTPDGIEFWGSVNFMKAGIIGADIITTVSPTYAKEILTKEQGFGLDGLLRKRQADLKGILNGIDYSVWDPEKDSFIPGPYSVKDPKGKKASKAALIKACGFRNADLPIAGFIGRLSSQKGIEFLLSAAGQLVDWGLNIVILGKGDEVFTMGVEKISSENSGRIRSFLAFDEALSHLIYAGSDLFLMPSVYEPCGLGQMIAMRYGTPPVARETGGLADTIEDYSPIRGKGTGFLFQDESGPALKEAIRSALAVYENAPLWNKVIKSGMRRDFSWRNSAKKYLELYQELSR